MKEFNQTKIDKIYDVTSVISLFRTELPPQILFDEEKCDFWQMFYMEEGERTIKVDCREYPLKAGGLLFYPPHIPHSFVSDDNKPCKIGMVSLHCQSDAMDFFRNKSFSLKAIEKRMLTDILMQNSSVFKWFAPGETKRGMYVVDGTPAGQLYRLRMGLEAFLTFLYTNNPVDAKKSSGRTSRKRNENEITLSTINKYLRQNINKNLCVEQIAKECGQSVSVLKRIMKEETNCGLMDYFNDLKIQEAMVLIKNSTLNVSEISENLGFSSPFYFSRMFKKKTGISPLEYSKMLPTNRQ